MNAFLAVDWGASNVRGWRLDADGEVAADFAAPWGVALLEPGQAQTVFERDIRPALGGHNLPALLCGMAGSSLGWKIAPYLTCPAGLDEIAAAVVRVAPSVYIVPGLRCAGLAGASEVMRGEETQFIGWIAAQPVRRSGRWLLCHPGTHAKWIELVDGRVTRFVTAMTGEMFALLSTHSILRTQDGAAEENAFAEGLDAAGNGDLFSLRLFSARGRVVADGANAGSAHSYLSGLLIGAEIGAALRVFPPENYSGVHVIGAPELTAWYETALRRRCVPVCRTDGEAAVIAGLKALVEKGALRGS